MTFLSATTDCPPVSDQARRLRAMVAERGCDRSSHEGRSGHRSLALISGKGGVGKSVIALNLAIALKRQGASAGLLDVSVGSSHLGLLCGLNGYWNFEHVLAGSRRLSDVMLTGPGNLSIVPGAAPLLTTTGSNPGTIQDLKTFQNQHDWLIVDTAADLSLARRAACAADCAVIVTTAEPTSVAVAYSAMKMLSAAPATSVSVLINQVDSERQAMQILDRLRQAARSFLRSDIGLAGWIPFDTAVSRSVFQRSPLAEVDSNGPACVAIEQIAQRLTRTVARRIETTFVEALQAPKGLSPSG